MNKLMLMSGKKDHNSADVEEFSEVGLLPASPGVRLLSRGRGTPCRVSPGQSEGFGSGNGAGTSWFLG